MNNELRFLYKKDILVPWLHRIDDNKCPDNRDIKNEIESYHYDILWEEKKVFFNIYYDSWSRTAKDYHIKDGYLYCRLKDLSSNWIENRKKILPFTKYCNINGKIQEE